MINLHCSSGVATWVWSTYIPALQSCIPPLEPAFHRSLLRPGSSIPTLDQRATMRPTYSALALVFSACALAADYKTVKDDIANITTLLSILNADAKAVAPGVQGLASALQLEVDAVKLHSRIVVSTNDANASPPFGGGGSLAIGLSFIALEPQIVSTLASISSQSASLGDLDIVVLSSLYQLKQDTDLFGTAVVAKLDALEAAIAPGIIKKIDAAFDNAIVTYGGKREHCQFSNRSF